MILVCDFTEGLGMRWLRRPHVPNKPINVYEMYRLVYNRPNDKGTYFKHSGNPEILKRNL